MPNDTYTVMVRELRPTTCPSRKIVLDESVRFPFVIQGEDYSGVTFSSLIEAVRHNVQTGFCENDYLILRQGANVMVAESNAYVVVYEVSLQDAEGNPVNINILRPILCGDAKDGKLYLLDKKHARVVYAPLSGCP